MFAPANHSEFDWLALLGVPSLLTLVGMVLTVIGWGTVWRLNIRAQRRNLRNQILESARKEIVEALDAYETWISCGLILGMALSEAARRSFDVPPHRKETATGCR